MKCVRVDLKLPVHVWIVFFLLADGVRPLLGWDALLKTVVILEPAWKGLCFLQPVQHFALDQMHSEKTHDALSTVSKRSLTSQNTQDAFTQCPNNNRISLYLMPFIVSHSPFSHLHSIFNFFVSPISSMMWMFFFFSCLPPAPHLNRQFPLNIFSRLLAARKKG